MIKETEREALTRLLQSASPELESAVRSALAAATEGGTATQLAHIVLSLLADEKVQKRMDSQVRAKAKDLLTRQIFNFPQVSGAEGHLGFRLPDLVEPAIQLAADWGASEVSPVTFLATSLSAEIPLDDESARTREALRSAGLRLEMLGARAGQSDARRQDFTFKSLGFGTDITAMVQAGVWPSCPLVGMDEELRTLAKVLNSDMGSACIAGEPGVGKSAFIQGFAWKIAIRDRTVIPESMDSWAVVMIEASDIMSGMGVRGALDTRVKEMISFFGKNPNVVPFFEEMHRLLDTEDASSKTVATALKPAMANGFFRCVGATTDREYARYIAGDSAMDSRFTKILLREPSREEARKIISASRSNILRGRASPLNIELSDEAISAAIEITSTYQRMDRLPRKAINLLKAVVAERVFEIDLKPGQNVSRRIGEQEVAKLFSTVRGIPVDTLDASRPEYYIRLAKDLNKQVKGQTEAVESVVSRLALHSRGWVSSRRPRGRFLFLGPPGVGKTELALSLAGLIMLDRGSLVTLNMADYQGEGARNKFMGADPGYKGYGETSTVYSRVMMRPYSVVILDEFEKSDESLSNPLIAVLDGSAEDSQARRVDFSQCIFVMTSNAVVRDPKSEEFKGFAGCPAALGRIEDAKERAKARDKIDEDLRGALAKQGGIWTLPLLDRIDRVCVFQSLGSAVLFEILDGMIEALRAQAPNGLPPAVDDEDVRREIVADATSDGDAASARRLERALLRWLAVQLESAAEVGNAAAAGASAD